jgi:CTP synthase
MKYIFVTGGVVSSVGKGLTAAALGALLEEYGYSVKLQKFDPYLNVDPGTMNPYQHGEVYVLDDGAECDLDLGHYERFTSQPLSKTNNLTAGQVYEKLISMERRGDFLGQTIQVIPHVTNVIKQRIQESSKGCDILITEIGGTVGDIEGMPFLEAIRQWAQEVGHQNACFIHVSLIPYVAAAGEQKSKPTQMSVAKLREIGISPDALVCRVDHPIEESVKDKLALFCNVDKKAIIEEIDVKDSIYEVPLMLRKEGLDAIILKRLGLKVSARRKSPWEEVVRRIKNPKYSIRVGVVGKYMEIQDAYKSVFEALQHGAIAHDAKLELVKIDAEAIEKDGATKWLKGCNAVVVPGGFGNRGIAGKIKTAEYARTHKMPYLGLCLGLQIAAIEFCRNVLGLKQANSTEFDAKTPDPVVYYMEEQKSVVQKGGTMRLGGYRCVLQEGTKAAKSYGKKEIRERHRHRYEFNKEKYASLFEKNGMIIAGRNPERGLVEILEIKDHPFFVGVQFHPEFLSKPTSPHPLFAALIAAGLKVKSNKR